MADEFKHDPQAVLDYSVDWGQWIGQTETVVAAAWTLPTGLTRPAGHATDTVTGTVSTVWVEGGVVGQNYTLTCHVTTSEGREDDHSILLRCRDK